ncbi:hypothetical protein MLD38_028673 [Melastoma candidum]|uniref:Uncharacterized protein n=1 Tax=Melastoma candidum TaxID=119954 RepID=A0ACB9N2A1_9MYRT|nr:hypothetical protein MLD38_028673 [Melastoma candidum]
MYNKERNAVPLVEKMTNYDELHEDEAELLDESVDSLCLSFTTPGFETFPCIRTQAHVSSKELQFSPVARCASIHRLSASSSPSASSLPSTHPAYSSKAANKGVRPIIPNDYLPTLRDIMTQCWDGDPDVRPSFNEVVRMLEYAEAEIMTTVRNARFRWCITQPMTQD